MTTTSRERNFAWLATSAVALALGLMMCANVFAQSTAATRNAAAQPNAADPKVLVAAEDMRLWTFGDCDRRFPYVATPEHQECVRVVAAPEAVEARAMRVCDASHPSDKEEAERCKANYKANRIKAATAGIVASTPALQAPSAEVMRRVKAITSAAVEAESGSARASPVAEPEREGAAPPDESAWKSTLTMVVLLAVAVGLGVTLLRRKQAQAA